jgi:hypothetical protein
MGMKTHIKQKHENFIGRYFLSFVIGALFTIGIITLVISLNAIPIAKAIRSFIPINNFTERIIEHIIEKESYKILGPMIRMEINGIVKFKIDYFINIYSKIVKRVDVATVIIRKCLAKDIPINVGFALAFRESTWNPNAINIRIINGIKIIDRGLYQLSDNSFPKNTDWFNIEVNTELGLSKLKEKYDKYKSWEIALTLYNGGSFGNIGKASLEHLSAILQKERELDVIFSDAYKEVIK